LAKLQNNQQPTKKKEYL